MSTNPYAPPATDESQLQPPRVLLTTGRVVVVLYGLLFGAFCAWGMTVEAEIGTPAVEIVGWSVFFFVTCFGCFALAMPKLRFRFCRYIWRYVALVIPIVFYSSAVWDIMNDRDPMTLVDSLAVGAIFLLATTPAIIFNFLLHRRLITDVNDLTGQVS